MAKKKSGKGKAKNPELRGGKNTLPQKSTGAVDVKKVTQNGAEEKKKKWVDKKVVKDATKPKQSIKLSPKITPSPSQLKGVNRLKATAKATPKPSKQAPAKQANKAKGISKLKVATPKKTQTTKKPSVKKAPVKGR
jgi:hypothetical protein